MPLLETRFRPAAGLAHPIIQTAFPVLARRPPRTPTARERWETPDGDFLDVEVLEPGAGEPGFLVLVHGLEGSTKSQYMLGMLALAREAGMGAVAMNFRSCSGEPNRKARSYHSGETGDLTLVVDRALERWPGLPGAIAGFSLGGNVTLCRMADWGKDAPARIRAAVAVSCPFDLALCGAAIDEPKNFWVRDQFLRTMREKAIAKAALFPDVIDAAAVRRASTIRAFDDLVTAPLNGYRDAAEYWTRASSLPRLERIARPTFLLSAEDDPLIPARCHPVDLARESPHVLFERSPTGGHVGFVAGSVFRPRFYAEERAMAFVRQQLSG